MKRVTLAVLMILTAAACQNEDSPIIGPGTTSPIEVESPVSNPPDDVPALGLQLITEKLSEPVALTTRPGDDRIYVAERTGTVVMIEDGRLVDEPFLDVTAEVFDEDREQGLLGITFDRSGERFFALYTDLTEAVRVVSYDAGPSKAKPDSVIELLNVAQPFKYHQGGVLEIGPDGYLWMGLGDGGLIGDPDDYAQNPLELLGSIVRLDIDAATPYALPPTNPFVGGSDGAGEVWAYGLRNPWRLAFDAGFVYIADVGHYEREEINIVSIEAAGTNFGWAVREGDICFESEECPRDGFTEPMLALPHDQLCAIVGGPVYRGGEIPELTGHYFYGDFCSGWIRSLVFDGSEIVATYDLSDDLDLDGQLTTFGVDPDGEILVATQQGSLYRIVRAP